MYVHTSLRMQKRVTDAMKSTVNTPKGQVTNLLVSSGTPESRRKKHLNSWNYDGKPLVGVNALIVSICRRIWTWLPTGLFWSVKSSCCSKKLHLVLEVLDRYFSKDGKTIHGLFAVCLCFYMFFNKFYAWRVWPGLSVSSGVTYASALSCCEQSRRWREGLKPGTWTDGLLKLVDFEGLNSQFV